MWDTAAAAAPAAPRRGGSSAKAVEMATAGLLRDTHRSLRVL